MSHPSRRVRGAQCTWGCALLVVACATSESGGLSSAGSGGERESIASAAGAAGAAGSAPTAPTHVDDDVHIDIDAVAGSSGQGGAAPQVELACGDGLLGEAEGCDDGNAQPGDGCSGLCQIEAGYICGEPGEPCELAVRCGDFEVGEGESCDDGNTVGGDGCAANCSSVDRGYVCPSDGGTCVETVDACGNAALEQGEQCDDGNATPGDGCSANCQIEPGYLCPSEGASCRTIEFCGDGLISYTKSEICDDGNGEPGDGCSEACRIELGWVCTGEPSDCVNDVVCGDRRVRGAETCDDGGTAAGDGCSDECLVEEGWMCPTPGASCRPVCGDGSVLGREECDDLNRTAGDGCSETCHEEPGWVCPAGEACRATVCGDGAQEGAESCDDGNPIPFDGCSSSCLAEPVCGSEGDPSGACTSLCGDGILVVASGEACDDGNNLDGDGCSATCETEPGFECESFYEDPPDSIAIPIIYRDFQDSHPDFGSFCCADQPGIVEPLLGPDRKPLYSGTDAAPVNTTSGETSFNQWYRDVADVNMTFYEQLTLQRTPAGAYSMDSRTDEPWASRTGFYPLEEEVVDPDTGAATYEYWGFGNEWLSHNYLFTSELRYWFEYQGGETLSFSGDDDVWVFVNGHLAVDLGGVHARSEGAVTLTLGADGQTNAAYGLTLGNIYEIVLFQAERWCCESNYWVTLSNFVAGRSQCSPVCGDGILTADEACDLGVDAQGDSLNTGEYGGCTSDCQLSPFCGDGAKNGAEECDDGANVVPYDSSGSSCAPGCVEPHFCGDGVLDTSYGELCDGGAENSDDAYGPGACSGSCQIGPLCGDGLLNGDEECDDGADNGSLASDCDIACQIKCGNGVLEAPEECDLGAESNTGEYGGCNSGCTRAPYCGDAVRNGEETCDDGVNDGSYGHCTADCHLGEYCGDEIVNGPEACDLGEANEANPYGRDRCTTRCDWAPYCGDGTVQAQEQCDGGVDCTGECMPAPVT